MKPVEASEILGNPRQIGMQVGCPYCQERAMAFEDGSIVCIIEGGRCFAPESTDRDLYKLRQRFDQERGITPAARLKVSAAIRSGRALPLSEFRD